MGEVTLKVRAEYVETLRGAVVAEVGFWHRAMTEDLAEIREARAEPFCDEDRAAFREGDLADRQRTLGESSAVVDQLPAPGSKVAAELHARSSVLAGVSDEAMRICIKDLAGETEYAPLAHERLRTKMEELEWWITQMETFEVEVASTKMEAS